MNETGIRDLSKPDGQDVGLVELRDSGGGSEEIDQRRVSPLLHLIPIENAIEIAVRIHRIRTHPKLLDITEPVFVWVFVALSALKFFF